MNRPAWSWALYDWANSAFATTVMAGFFPVFFKQYWAGDLAVTDSTFWLGLANSLAAVVMVLFAPLIGTYADRRGLKKWLVITFATLGIATTAGLFLVAAGYWMVAIALYGLAVVGFSGANVVYDALLLDVASRDRLEVWSARGFALGYLGGGALFALNVLSVLQPHYFGFEDSAEAVRYAFLSVAMWWAVFSLPLLLFVREQPQPSQPAFGAWSELRQTYRELRQLPMTFTFLIAYWLYIDGVDTIVRMAVDYGLSIGFEANDLLTALLITQFVGFPAALVFGRLGDRLGAKGGIGLGLAVYVVVVFWAAQMQAQWEFYALAVVIGLVQGGVQALSRALYARLIPKEHAGRFFGLYNMMGKFAAVIGPVMVGWISALSGDPRTGILSIIVLFVAGALLLARVDPVRGEQMAGSY